MLRQWHALAHSDDTHVVDLFREDHDVIGSLHDRVVVVVKVVREHRRAGVGAVRHDAALGEPPIFWIVELTELAIERLPVSGPLLSLWCQRRNAAVRGVRNERASRLTVVDGNPVAPVDIDVVVVDAPHSTL